MDYVVTNPAGDVFNREIKTGNSRYTPKQERNDKWIEENTGIKTKVIRFGSKFNE